MWLLIQAQDRNPYLKCHIREHSRSHEHYRPALVLQGKIISKKMNGHFEYRVTRTTNIILKESTMTSFGMNKNMSLPQG